LDDVHCDLPVGVWSIQNDGSSSKAMIRNNLWKGYTAWHKANSFDHGALYVGDGLKNDNFCFTN
jgi:hypothetical protein